MKSADEIVALFRERQRTYGPSRDAMRAIAKLYNSDIAVPLPELRKDERPAVANLAKQGINQLGMRAASVLPNIICPPVQHGRQEDAKKRAKDRHKVLVSWWEEQAMQIRLRQRGRWLFAYADSPSLITPCFKTSAPKWHTESPLNCYPAPLTGVTDMVPIDTIIAKMHTVGYMRRMWPDNLQLQLMVGDSKPDTAFEVLMYVDHEECVVVATPHMTLEQQAMTSTHFNAARQAVVLDRTPNLTGRPWGVTARLISLEQPIGLFDGVIGMYEAQAELDALSRIARRKGVFWEEWLVADQTGAPEILVQADPMQGIIGQLRGGTLVRHSPEVQYATDSGIDRLERAQRVEAGIPPDFGGEAGSNVRTGARAASLLANSVDPVLQEGHELFARSLKAENEIAIAIDKAYFNRPKIVSFSAGEFEYRPSVTWETDKHLVDYAMAGADLNQMTIVGLQLVGAGIMSKESAAELHPLIKDAAAELRKVQIDQLDQAIMANVQALAQDPQGMPLPDVVKLRKLIGEGKDLPDALEQVQREAQERQARVAEEAAQAQPGIAIPGQGMEQPMIPEQNDSMGNLTRILGGLRMQQMTTPPERGVA